MIKRALTPLAQEFAGADLGDQRRDARLQIIAGQLELEPGKGFPRAMGSDAALEAFYRFINNDGFAAEHIVAPHIAASMARAAKLETVLAIHDTTFVEFAGEREDLGPTTGKNRYGFAAHAALLVDDEDGLPVGVGYLETLKRTGKKWNKRKKQGQRGRVQTSDATRESLRWIRGVEAVEDARSGDFEVIHVTDAEGDFFDLLAALQARGGRFVIRAGQLDRTVLVDEEEWSLRELIDTIIPSAWRVVDLGERKHPPRANIKTRRRHPDRTAHRARLAIGSTRVMLRKTKYSANRAEPFQVNVVRVWETQAHRSDRPIEWVLLTSEDVRTRAALERVVDIYRKRWTIEEYFKALKSGCSLEKRQIESYDALCKVLALFVPIAYRLLLLRGLERASGDAPARFAFSDVDLYLMQNAPSNAALSPPKTVADAMLHLARLGGHIRNNGRPGWQTLAWGYEKLLTMRLGWQLATGEKCDQS